MTDTILLAIRYSTALRYCPAPTSLGRLDAEGANTWYNKLIYHWSPYIALQVSLILATLHAKRAPTIQKWAGTHLVSAADFEAFHAAHIARIAN